MRKMKRLLKKPEIYPETIEAIQKLTDELGYAPSVRQLTEELGLSSTSITSFRLDRLSEEDYIRRDPRVARSIRVTRKGRQLVSDKTNQG